MEVKVGDKSWRLKFKPGGSDFTLNGLMAMITSRSRSKLEDKNGG